MDVNEKIVDAWLQHKGFFTKNSINYGQFHNDIDILAVDLKKVIIWDCEVKVRTGSTQISKNHNKQNGFYKFVETFNDPERKKAINNCIGCNGYEISKKFITTKSLFGKSVQNQSKWVSSFEEEGIDVIFFDEIIRDLSKHAKESKKSTNEIVQVLRLYHIYEIDV